MHDLHDLLDVEPGLEVVGEASTAEQSLARVPALRRTWSGTVSPAWPSGHNSPAAGTPDDAKWSVLARGVHRGRHDTESARRRPSRGRFHPPHGARAIRWAAAKANRWGPVSRWSRSRRPEFSTYGAVST